MFSIKEYYKERQSKANIKRLYKMVEKINEFEPEIEKLSDEELKAKTNEFRSRVKNGESLDDILFEAFAVVREASKRVYGMRHYDVQFIGGIVIHEGNISEMKTGEGKTLVAVAPVYLNSLTGQGVHVVTANEYLASRDAEIMEELYNFLDLKVAVNLNSLSPEQKRVVYQADVIYTTSSELGFDYLRDNMASRKELRVQNKLSFALIDEVDSILVDEARTPLIISGPSNKPTQLYVMTNAFVRNLKLDKHYTYDEKEKNVTLTEEGIDLAEASFGIKNLFDNESQTLLHHIQQSLKAHTVMQKNIDYVVQDNEVKIVDSYTGRIMNGRRFSDGLHQALEAKENVRIQKETMTMATVTIQNYFRMYQKLSGMTGTAKTEEEEFQNIYNMDVVVIPTHRPIQRIDLPDMVFITFEGKLKAMVKEVKERHKTGQPILIGTASVDTSEILSRALTEEGVPHNVLNAKNHEREAEIIAEAGQLNMVTIATNMAGRGTDIKLGEGVVEVGGLAVLGFERNESRRIDNQLRGRAGRQGDVGFSQFYVSLQDELMKRFGSDRLANIITKLGIDDDEDVPMESKMITRSIESALKRVEGNNFDSRKQLLQYDNVINDQRKVIYEQRNKLLDTRDATLTIEDMISSQVAKIVNAYYTESANNEEKQFFLKKLNDTILPNHELTVDDISGEFVDVLDKVEALATELHNSKKKMINEEDYRQLEATILLSKLDEKWLDHINMLDQLRAGIHLRGYAQIDPLREYQLEGYKLYEELLENIEAEAVQHILRSKFGYVQQEEEQDYKEITAEEELPQDEQEEVVKN